MAATLAWYQLAGFDTSDIVAGEGRAWAEVARDGLTLQLLAGDTPWPGPPGLSGCFYAYPQSVDSVYAEIGGRVECPWGVEERSWGARELVVVDPDGYVITFTS